MRRRFSVTGRVAVTACLAVSMALVASGSPVVAATKGAGIGSAAAKAGPNCDAADRQREDRVLRRAPVRDALEGRRRQRRRHDGRRLRHDHRRRGVHRLPGRSGAGGHERPVARAARHQSRGGPARPPRRCDPRRRRGRGPPARVLRTHRRVQLPHPHGNRRGLTARRCGDRDAGEAVRGARSRGRRGVLQRGRGPQDHRDLRDRHQRSHGRAAAVPLLDLHRLLGEHHRHRRADRQGPEGQARQVGGRRRADHDDPQVRCRVPERSDRHRPGPLEELVVEVRRAGHGGIARVRPGRHRPHGQRPGRAGAGADDDHATEGRGGDHRRALHRPVDEHRADDPGQPAGVPPRVAPDRVPVLRDRPPRAHPEPGAVVALLRPRHAQRPDRGASRR